LAIVIFAAVVISVVLGLYISSIIAKPLTLMKKLLEQVGDTGNLNFSDEDMGLAKTASSYKDEVANSMKAFIEMLEQFKYYGGILETVAGNDLTISVKTLGDSDTCGVALKDMVDNLNSNFKEVSVAASQVSGGSTQVAQASQNLATGASEQAATIEEFTANVTEIQKVSEENTRIATDTLKGVKNSEKVMESCSGQMQQMLSAMYDIDNKSQSISKVIKVIDDIAFQTNILALNAAVEAARAGQHGKGFAVVADEVRNLASKSADAAKETADLIASSSQSVAEGNQIVEKVSVSLQEVSDISAKNAESIGTLYAASNQQSESMGEVTTAITQLSTVVQSNSATAEETAASSEEMSAQADLLSRIVSRFKLRDEPQRGAPKISLDSPVDYSPIPSSGYALSSGNEKY
jgi:methyl-accepting chemotaxis protein